VSPGGDQRGYVIPDGTPWDNVLGWLIHKAMPASRSWRYSPAAGRLGAVKV
jgi:hypothetical protein